MDYTEFKRLSKKKESIWLLICFFAPLGLISPLLLISFIFPVLFLFVIPLLISSMIFTPILYPYILREKEKRDRQKAQYLADAIRDKTVIDKRW